MLQSVVRSARAAYGRPSSTRLTVEERLSSQLQRKEQSVSHLIGPEDQSDEERLAEEFCEDLKNLSEVSEVRGCSQRRMGQAMIGCGLQVLKEGCNEDTRKALTIARTMLTAWKSFAEAEEEE